MQIYHYAFWLLTLSVVLANTGSLSRSIDNEKYEEVYDPNNSYDHIDAPYSLTAYLNNPLAFEITDGTAYHRPLSFERQRRSIRKGDSSEFMG
ncbi:unnamed protein product [Rotaria socialis]|uniref:Uncharacterized protein n=1 Tax=Rotaria socialis TaxID=392032 RepID=A0A821M7R6_9BILA|nr:unnamed protein product [Rotaria socialis]CAF3304512.1 unnamed protein product [Rotaria socialis]CAF3351803.1 unnamed protein product [Rotaria socialis]CAF3371028.1 unnamed protein product [Rotaria socialis]CAF3460360.1 unnamed protein product [Rotaria socialis]